MPNSMIITSGAPYYIDLGTRGGTLGIFGVVVTAVSGTSPSLAIDIETKNFTDTSWTTTASFSPITTATSGVKVASSIKQQVRLKCTQTGSGTPYSVLDVFQPSYLP